DKTRDVLAHIGFVERMYVESPAGRVEFGVRRAYLSIDDGGAGKLKRNEDWTHLSTHPNVYYVIYRDAPHAITVCIDPAAGRNSLSDLPLPPAERENYLSKPALAAPDTVIGTIRASLAVSFCAEGLYLVGEDWQKPTPAVAKKIAAIVSVLARKEQIGE